MIRLFALAMLLPAAALAADVPEAQKSSFHAFYRATFPDDHAAQPVFTASGAHVDASLVDIPALVAEVRKLRAAIKADSVQCEAACDAVAVRRVEWSDGDGGVTRVCQVHAKEEHGRRRGVIDTPIAGGYLVAEWRKEG